MKVLLSTTLVVNEGTFKVVKLTKEQAERWVNDNVVINYCGHATTLILGITPAATREQCESYTEALCLKPLGRLEFGKEYTREEIEQIGVDFTLITKLGN